jgi:hypothetical protein
MALKRWIWIGLALFAFVGVGCLGLVGAGAYFVSRHLDVREVSRDQANAEFAELRARFKDQKPLLEVRRGSISMRALEEKSSRYQGPLPTSLCLLAWEEGEEKRARLCIPFWLLKLKSGKGMKLGGHDAGIERIEVAAEDLERAGPSLLLDRVEGRHRLLMWTE